MYGTCYTWDHTDLPATHTCRWNEPYLPLLPSHRASPHFGCYSFPVPLRVGDWVGLVFLGKAVSPISRHHQLYMGQGSPVKLPSGSRAEPRRKLIFMAWKLAAILTFPTVYCLWNIAQNVISPIRTNFCCCFELLRLHYKSGDERVDVTTVSHGQWHAMLRPDWNQLWPGFESPKHEGDLNEVAGPWAQPPW